MKKTLMSLAAIAALGLVGVSASATGIFQEFTVQEGVVLGAESHVLIADKLNGGYVEFLAPTGTGTTFSASAIGNIGQFYKNDGAVLVGSQLNGVGMNGYGMYAVFTATGNIIGPDQFVGTGGGFELYVDPLTNTTFSSFDETSSLFAPSPYAPGVADTGTATDDIKLASTFTTESGSGNLDGPPGAFNIVFKDFLLTDFGKTYFISPDPFYLRVQINGDYDKMVYVTDSNGNVTPLRTITGDVSAVFPIPEPDSMALLGIGLAGLAFFQRRRKQVK